MLRALVALAALLAVLVGAASAAVVRGNERANRLVGTPRADLIVTGGGRDVVRARGGNDRIDAYDLARDSIACGRGRDLVTADLADRVARDCELVGRAISRDRSRGPRSQHETQVEPDTFAWGSTVVAVFQSGRYRDGGADEIGFATSHDGGRRWRSGFLPGLTVRSRPAGAALRASDPVVAYDAAHRVWLVATLALERDTTALYVSRSADGLSWSAPVVAARAAAPANERIAFDKEWITCDNAPASPFRGRCYLSYTDIAARDRISTRASDDGGRTWSQPATAGPRGAVGAQPVVRPNGDVVVPYLEFDPWAIGAIRSTDGGRTWDAPDRVAVVRRAPVPGLRAFPLPAADVDPQGRVYVVWADCRPGCAGNGLAIAVSPDGDRWNSPTRVAAGPGNLFVPALAVDPQNGRLALAHHAYDGRIQVRLVSSGDGGATWSRPQALAARPMRPAWVAATTSGRMTGDYIGVSHVPGATVVVWSLGSQPRGGRLRQATFAMRLESTPRPVRGRLP